jgi:hypothetical protein
VETELLIREKPVILDPHRTQVALVARNKPGTFAYYPVKPALKKPAVTVFVPLANNAMITISETATVVRALAP